MDCDLDNNAGATIINWTDGNGSIRTYNRTPFQDICVSQWNFNDGNTTNTTDSCNVHDTDITGAIPINAMEGAGIFFDGTNDYFSLGTDTDFAFGTGDFAVSFWFQTNDSARGEIWNKGSNGANTGFNIFSSGGNITLTMLDANNLNTNIDTPLNDGELHHVVAMRESGTNKIYIDGDLNASLGGTGGLNITTTLTAYVGVREGSALFFNGTLDEYKVFNTSLTAQQVAVLFNGTISETGNITTENLGVTNVSTKILASSIPTGTSVDLWYNGTGSFVKIQDDMVNDTLYGFTPVAGGELRYELQSSATESPSVYGFNVTDQAVDGVFDINITNPTNTTFNFSFIQVNLAVTAANGSLNTTLLTFPGTTNLSITNGDYVEFPAQTNIPLVVWANDSGGNASQDNVTFSIVLPNLNITIQEPQNITYLSTLLAVNFSISNVSINASVDTILLSHPGVVNETITTNHTRNFPNNATNFMTLWANTTNGENATATVFFSVIATQNITLYDELQLPDFIPIGENTTIRFLNATDSTLEFQGTCLVGFCTINVSDGLFFAVAGGEPGTYGSRNMQVNVSNGSIVGQNFMFLANDSTFDTVFRLNDQTGDFPAQNTTIRIGRSILNGSITVNVVISEFLFDVEAKFDVALVQEEVYTARITSGSNVRELGVYKASSEGERTFNVGEVNIQLSGDAFWRDVFWGKNMSEGGDINFVYNDSRNQTTNLQFRVFNGSNTSDIIFTSTIPGPIGFVAINFTVPNINLTYTVEFNASVEGFSPHGQRFFMAAPGILGRILVGSRISTIPGMPGWILQGIAVFMLVIVGMTTNPKNIKTGTGMTLAIAMLLSFFGFLAGYTGFILVMIVVSAVHLLGKGEKEDRGLN
jgi:hypothetical protein